MTSIIGLPTVFDVRDYGSTATAAAATRAINLALAAAADAGGGIVQLPPGAITTQGGHQLAAGVQVRGFGTGGTVVTHEGGHNAVCFASAPNVVDVTSAIAGLQLLGNTDAGAIGIRHGDQWGFRLADVLIEGYTAGTGWRFYNDAGWTEGTEAAGVRIRNCGVGISLMRSAASLFDSFGYTRLLGVGINVPFDGAGIVLGDPAELVDTHYTYHSELHINFWLDTDATAVVFSGESTGAGNFLCLTGENESAATGTRAFSGAAAADWSFDGIVQIAANNTDYPGGVTNGLVVSQDPARAAAVFRAAAGQTAATVEVQESDGTAAVRLYEWGGVQAPFITLGDLSGPYISAGAGTPEGAVNGTPGALYLRNDGGAGATLYVKETGTGNTGWAAK